MKSCRHKSRGCKFSHVGASFQLALPRQDDKIEILSPQETWVQVFPSHVGASFQLALPRQDDTIEISSPQREVGASFPMWVRVFNLHFPDKMKSRRHKEGWHLILSWFRAENIPPILLRSLFQRAVSANGKKGTKTAKAEASPGPP